MAETVKLKLAGRRIDKAEGEAQRAADLPLPALLKPALRSGAGSAAHDEFIPEGYLALKAAFDVSEATRSAGAADEHQLDAQPGEVLVVELDDGSTLITSADKLKESLLRARPDLIGPEGAILFERLRIEGATQRGLLGAAAGGLVKRVFALVARGPDGIVEDAIKLVGGRAAEVGVTWAGTKALMWAIESRLKLDRDEPLKGEGGTLWRWDDVVGGETKLAPVDADELAAAADPQQPKPILVFLHGTASSTLGSFGDLNAADRDVWSALQRRYKGGIYAFEHRTFSEGPIENALKLASSLPQRARLSFVTHSRGGLVADLLCLGDFAHLIDDYRHEMPGTGDADPGEAARVKAELGAAHKEQREQLARLAALLRDKQFVVERYLRVASPARGTKLASGNFDLFLSGLLTLIGQVPYFFGSPLYAAFKRVVIEIAKNRTNPHLVPGIEAMLPDSPLARLLRDAPARPGIAMAVIAGDIEGGNLLKRLGVLLTDFLLFESVDNDLVVDTGAMLGGIAPQAGARVLFDRGPAVSHFRYFDNLDTRFALRDWLVSEKPAELPAFQPLPGRFTDLDALAESEQLRAAATRGGVVDPATLPVVVILPGVMGSHLWLDRRNRIWFDPASIATGGLKRIAWGRANVEAEKLFGMFYGDLAGHLAASHRVERFAYDWRQPLDVLGERFGEFLDGLLKSTERPIRLLAHSMGGLVVRACIYKRRAVMDALMQREGARLIMLGTPNQGAHSMVENLIGKGDTLRNLVRLDLEHDMQQVLDIVAGFRGPLQLLPRPGFVDTFQGQSDGGIPGLDYGRAETWTGFKPKVFDFWFGNGRCATPEQEVLESASWLWKQDGTASTAPSLPESYAAKSIYVFGVAPNTACGIREQGGRLKMVGTTRGDGTVTWDSGRIGNVGRYYYMQAVHGALPSTQEHFPALVDLLASGSTARLPATPPVLRDVVEQRPVAYDAGPPVAADEETIALALVGGTPRSRLTARPKRRLEVAVKAMDLRFLREPILVGHYEQDTIAGPQKLIDEMLGGDLSERHRLGLYAGPRGTATIVLRVPNEQERRRNSLTGAVVAGLGPYDRPINANDLAEAVRAGVLRYLLQVIDVLGKGDEHDHPVERAMPLAAVLIGFNSSANMSVAASVEALLRGVLDANEKFHQTTRLPIRVARLDIVELYLDTAITAVYALRDLTAKLAATAAAQRTLLVCKPELEQGEGVRQRLFDTRGASYWPRLIVTDANRRDDECPPHCYEQREAASAGAPGAGAPAAASATGTPAVRALAPIAEKLRFVYVGQRARAESVMQQRQPGLVESLVRQQIHVRRWNPDIGRMLFQLLVPHDFKDAARQIDRFVLVVDSYTANLPWELMLADDARQGEQRPIALRTAVVRQLESGHYRRQVRQNLERSALVIGNPSVEGFSKAFAPNPDPVPLTGAEAEAQAIAGVLGGLGYEVETGIGSDLLAIDVFAKLYRRPYRFIHISAHGIFDAAHAGGTRRSGVVLSDGLLITAAEIDAMETVPELVFLNCCHLGNVDATVRDGNRLAASIARELIEIGVRCVVVAGWAVDDAAARAFGETFYRELLLERQPFGEAVFRARRAAWDSNNADITWGAFQAYGDAGWLAEPRAEGPDALRKERYASLEELLDALANLRAEMSRKRERLTDREIDAQARALKELIEERCPAAWLGIPALHSALGATWARLNRHDDARKAYLKAVRAEDKLGRVPIRDIEQLANMEARLGEKTGNEQMIRGALIRLHRLDALLASPGEGEGGRQEHAERSALRGSAWKRAASVYARRLLDPQLPPAELAGTATRMLVALARAVRAYRRAEGVPGQPRFSLYQALNRLALDSLTAWIDVRQRDAAIAMAMQCEADAAEAFRRQGDFFSAVMQPEALLVRLMLDGSLGAPGEAGQSAFEKLKKAYAEALSNMTATPNELDSAVEQMCLLSRFHDAIAVAKRVTGPDGADEEKAGADEHRAMAARLVELAGLLRPGSCKRDDRPSAPAGAPAKRRGRRAT